MDQSKEIGKIHSSGRAVALVSVLVFTFLPVLLLRTSVAGLAAGRDDIALVNPMDAMAGLGFVGLWLVFVWWFSCSYVSRERATDSPKSSQLLPVASIIIICLVAAGPLTNVYAKLHGYRRCVAEDRFQAGNVPKNDVTMHAYVRLDTTNASLKAHCDG